MTIQYNLTTKRQDEAMYLLELMMMLQNTSKHYTVEPATPADWLEATKNTAWRTEVTATRLLKARSLLSNAKELAS